MKKLFCITAAASILAGCGGPNLNCDDAEFKNQVVDHYNRTVLESIKKSLVSSAEGVLENPVDAVNKDVFGKIAGIRLSDVRQLSQSSGSKEATCSAKYAVTVDGQDFKNTIRYRLEYLLDSKKTSVHVFDDDTGNVSLTIGKAIVKYADAFRSANTEIRMQRETKRIDDFSAIENLYVSAKESAEKPYEQCLDKVDGLEARNRCETSLVENKYKIYRDLIGALPSKLDQCVNMRAFALYMENEGKSRSDQKPLLSSDINQWKEECKRSS